ncbi:MAG: alpha-amylase family glycosyl hydrolase, partial [Thermomicrobiales bacterium]|nr:alpha-amylase family glycosyl hydrolase [Thermomicrobiales bacterium]
MPELELGAVWLGEERVNFTVWAPKARTVEVHLLDEQSRYIALEPREHGYFSAVVDGISPGDRYTYRLDGSDEWPDPASRYQPDGVHSPSAIVDPAFVWTDADWRGIAQDELIIYELHVGTFSSEGTFDGVIPFLPYLSDLGVTAIELLPVVQFPGERNWGYDGVDLFAPHSAYGGPEGLRRLVDACHAHGLAVLLDVVYNHLGPEGNYLTKFGHYFTDRYHTPWGDAVNVDGPWSDEVRRFFVENALYWTREYHIDGFRLDATDRIIDESATHFLRQLS